jgi:hypothetical protein
MRYGRIASVSATHDATMFAGGTYLMLGRLGDREVVPTGGAPMIGCGCHRQHDAMGSERGARGKEQSVYWLRKVARRQTRTLLRLGCGCWIRTAAEDGAHGQKTMVRLERWAATVSLRQATMARLAWHPGARLVGENLPWPWAIFKCSWA